MVVHGYSICYFDIRHNKFSNDHLHVFRYEQVKVLYVKGLSRFVTDEILRDRFSPYGSIENVNKVKDYAFVHFEQREDALQVSVPYFLLAKLRTSTDNKIFVVK